MTLELRAVGRSEAEAFFRHVALAFGAVPDQEELEGAAARFEPDFALGVFDQGRIVASAGAYPLEMTVPAGAGGSRATVPVPGVTAVGVAPTHRRRGLLTRLMTHQLADLRDRGYPLSVLLASQSIIYGRFGYGWAQSYQSLVIESDHDAFRPDAPVAPGRMRMVEPDEVAKALPPIHDRARRQRPGELNRTTRWWDWHVKDPEKQRDGMEARMYAAHESAAGEADGWVSYRYNKLTWPAGIPRHQVVVQDLVATDAAVYAALWRFVLDLDLVEEVAAPQRPVDEPLRWLLADPRRLRTTEVGDHLWVRILDIRAALAARGYGAAERLVMEVLSEDPSASGRYVLETGPEGGHCRRAERGEKVALVLGLADLGALYLGGVPVSTLAAAGRVSEIQPGAVAAAERAFASPVAPYCTLHF
ncbi:MAG TPA: GNAT family N-acetyltransferase [Acidimicrobiales bacterium]|nr:GNAT family N-acetyltransferase [Acidimicrobiales bacterium]